MSSCKVGAQQNSVMTNISCCPIRRPTFPVYSDHHKPVRPCSVQLLDIFDYNDTEQHCIISVQQFKMHDLQNVNDRYQQFNKKILYNTRSYDDLTCKSRNVYHHFRQHGHSNLSMQVGSMKVRILEKICHPTINQFLSIHIPILHPLHSTSLIIDVYCRTFIALMTSWDPCCSSFQFSVLYILLCLSSSCVVCTPCCQCLQIVHS